MRAGEVKAGCGRRRGCRCVFKGSRIGMVMGLLLSPSVTGRRLSGPVIPAGAPPRPSSQDCLPASHPLDLESECLCDFDPGFLSLR